MDFQAFLITLRESLEAILIVGLILSFLTRLNGKKYRKWVIVGVGLALVTSYLVAMLFQVVLTGFATYGADIYFRVAIMFASVILLTHMVMFMKKQSNSLQGEMKTKIQTALTAGSISSMIIHSYLIVVREGIETVFFFAAISGGDIQNVLTSYGALSGLILALIIGYAFFSGAMKISLKAFFQITGVFIMFIAAGLLVQGIGVLQDLGVVGSVYEGADGKPAPVYNIVEFMPEHYIDEVQYERNTGESPLISGQVGLFMAAMFGYSQNPSVEQVVFYWLYFAGVIGWIKMFGKGRVSILQFKRKKTTKKVVQHTNPLMKTR
ncbi:FTR1 family iron permease [Terrihalobacillus insolitus]|uniref:FTR1 family iron permease n=1 Tax=Terrihalobacillus insolitus TaxID=2950438 RepID=UPI0023420AC3|nr:FTR1 family protein [Terrihalobacillus insolitus]MDC3413205.1 FTR1 family protein [Terrihalobacillus insolitus]